MKRVSRFLIRLYPEWWRQRYGKELEALLEDSGSHDVWDLFRGAMQMQMSRWSFGKTVMACGLVGVVLAGVFAFTRPYPYQSTATLKITPLDPEAFVRVTQTAFTRNALTTIINDYNLYPRERKDMPMEDVIDKEMRRAILIRPAGPNLARISFAYEDPIQAQRVSQDLVGRIIFANLDFRANAISPSDRTEGERIELVVAPDQAKRQIEGKARTAMTSLGLPAGLLFGVVLALILRRGARAAS